MAQTQTRATIKSFLERGEVTHAQQILFNYVKEAAKHDGELQKLFAQLEADGVDISVRVNSQA